MSTPEPLDKSFLVRMTATEHATLGALAAEMGVPMAAALRRLLQLHTAADHVVPVPFSDAAYARLREMCALRGTRPEAGLREMFEHVAALPEGYQYVAVPATTAGAPSTPPPTGYHWVAVPIEGETTS